MQRGPWRGMGLLLTMTSLTAVSACSQTPREPAQSSTKVSSDQSLAPAEYLVSLAAGADVSAITALFGQFGIKHMSDLGRNVFLVTLSEDPGPARMEELRAQSSQIKAVQPNFVYRGNSGGNIQ